MATYTNDYSKTIAALSEWAIRSSIKELEDRDRLTIALRQALRYGADINDLSADSGIPVAEIRRRTRSPLNVLSDDLELLAG
jgi:hypothetical protein